MPLLGGLGVTITEDRDRTEDLFFVDLDTMYPAFSVARAATFGP